MTRTRRPSPGRRLAPTGGGGCRTPSASTFPVSTIRARRRWSDWTQFVPAEWRALAQRIARAAAADPNAAVHRRRRGAPRCGLAGALPGDLGGVPQLVAAEGRRPATRSRRGRGGASPPHARAGRRPRASGPACRGRRHDGGHADAVESAAVHRRLLPDRGARPRDRRAGAASELRLRPAPVRGDGLPLPMVVAARARHRRLPVGPRGRRQRRRARRLADVRRPPEHRRGLRDPARDPLSARGRRRCPGGHRGAPTATAPALLQRHALRSVGPGRHGLHCARPPGARHRAASDHQPSRDGGVAASTPPG